MNIMIQYRPLQGPSYIPLPNEPTVDTDFGMAIAQFMITKQGA